MPLFGDKSDIINQIIYGLFSIIIILLLSAYHYSYKIDSDKGLTIKEFFFGYRSADFKESDAIIYKLSSSVIFSFMKSYPIVTFFVLHWASPVANLLKFWDYLKLLVSPLDFFDYIDKFETIVKEIYASKVHLMWVYREETQALINISYLIVVTLVVFITILRIKFSSVSKND